MDTYLFASNVLNSLATLSFVFELLALALAFYLKDTRIFFISLALLCARTTYLYASLYQAHLFVSLFLPFVFVLFVLLKNSILVFDKANLSKIAVLIFVGILALFLSKSTSFNDILSHNVLFTSFKPISQSAFILAGIEFFFLLVWGFYKKEMHFVFAFVFLFLQFIFQSTWSKASFFEFASIFFVFYLLYHSFKLAFFDTLTKLPNQKALKRYILGKEKLLIGALHFENFEELKLKQKKLLFKKIAKILKKQDKNIKIFSINETFILVFNQEKDFAQAFLSRLQRAFNNTSLYLKDKKIQLQNQSILLENQGNFEEVLQELTSFQKGS